MNLRSGGGVSLALIAEDGLVRPVFGRRRQLQSRSPAVSTPNQRLAVLQGLGARVAARRRCGLGKTVTRRCWRAQNSWRAGSPAACSCCARRVYARSGWTVRVPLRHSTRSSINDRFRAQTRASCRHQSVDDRATVVSSILSQSARSVATLSSGCGAGRRDCRRSTMAHRETDRRNAVQHLTARTLYVFLLTATCTTATTPRSRHCAAWDSTATTRGLQAIAHRGRWRQGTTGPHPLLVAPSDAERQMHAALDTLTQAIRRSGPTWTRTASQ